MKINKILILIIVILAIIIIAEYLWLDNKEGGNKAVAIVNGEKIMEDEFLLVLKEQYGQEALNGLINKLVIEEAAIKYGIDANQKEIERQYKTFMRDYNTEEEFIIFLEEQMGMTKDKLLAQIEHYAKWEEIATKDINVTDDQIEAYYKKNKENYSIPENYHIQQIVVSSEEEANQIIYELKNGSNFNALAKERTIDYLSISTGGDLGKVYVNDPSIDPAIINKAKTMKTNDIATVKIGDFYAIIQVLGHEKTVQYLLEDVKNEIRKEIALSQANSLPLVLEQLKEDMDVKILDKTLGNSE